MPFESATLLAAMKLENNLSDKVRRSCNTSLQNISIKAKPQIQSGLSDNVFSQLQQAIAKKRLVNIRYYSYSAAANISTNLSPYHLMYNENAWYVIGNSSFHKNVRSFKVNRIKELKMLDKCFVEPDKFNIDEYLGRAWSMKCEGRLYNVKLRFLPEVAREVAEVQWHSTQKVTSENNGSAIVEFRVDGLNEITWWILSYCDQVQVLAPRILRQRIIKIAQKILTTNLEHVNRGETNR
jgi:predicted DNA-binding transcriptional regulator YafY